MTRPAKEFGGFPAVTLQHDAGRGDQSRAAIAIIAVR